MAVSVSLHTPLLAFPLYASLIPPSIVVLTILKQLPANNTLLFNALLPL